MTETDQATEQQPIAWRAIVYDTPVHAAGGEQVGVVREVLGSDAEDVFHGIRVHLDRGDRDAMILSDDISLITKGRIDTSLAPEAVTALPEYKETDTFHLASVGWLRKHLGWKRDSGSDEEPG
jgi:hypothetical protein